jgi:hypothetical protein
LTIFYFQHNITAQSGFKSLTTSSSRGRLSWKTVLKTDEAV